MSTSPPGQALSGAASSQSLWSSPGGVGREGFRPSAGSDPLEMFSRDFPATHSLSKAGFGESFGKTRLDHLTSGTRHLKLGGASLRNTNQAGQAPPGFLFPAGKGVPGASHWIVAPWNAAACVHPSSKSIADPAGKQPATFPSL